MSSATAGRYIKLRGNFIMRKMPETRNPVPETRRDIRRFGLIAVIFFGALCTLGLWRQKPVPTYVFGILAIFGIGFLTIPATLRPLYDGWLKVAHGIGLVVTAIILTLSYYLVMTPAALIKRIFGGRPLTILTDRTLSTYWVTRAEPAQPRERFIKRY